MPPEDVPNVQDIYGMRNSILNDSQGGRLVWEPFILFDRFNLWLEKHLCTGVIGSSGAQGCKAKKRHFHGSPSRAGAQRLCEHGDRYLMAIDCRLRARTCAGGLSGAHI